MEVRYQQKVVGHSHVALADPGSAREVLRIEMDVRVPLPFRSVGVRRVSEFDRLPDGRCSRFHCHSVSDYQGFSFERWATNDGRKVEIRSVFPDGKAASRVYFLGKDFDVATGFRHPQVLRPEDPHKVLRFLDLHTAEVTRLDQTLVRRWLQTNQGLAEPMNEIITKWSWVSQRSIRWEAIDLPVTMEVRIPFIGTTTTSLVSRSVAVGL